MTLETGFANSFPFGFRRLQSTLDSLVQIEMEESEREVVSSVITELSILLIAYVTKLLHNNWKT